MVKVDPRIIRYGIRALPALVGTGLEMARNSGGPSNPKGKNPKAGSTKKTPKIAQPIKVKWKFKKRRRRKQKAYTTVNVKNDVTKFTKTYFKQKVTSQQQKKINRRFKDENNAFTYKREFAVIDTVPQTTNSCKWIWQCHNGYDYVTNAWHQFINPTAGQTNFDYNANGTADVQYAFNSEQAIYFHTFKSKYEILNPTNYDMHVDIYDVVCKKDTYGAITSKVSSQMDELDPTSSVHYPQSNAFNDPIQLMLKGTEAALYGVTPNYLNTDPTNMSLWDLQMAPTKSYPFNIYWSIVGKKRVTLQPGASMYHTFIHKPKCLLQKGYWAYRYQAQNHMGNSGIEDLTSGTLFKVWGQLAGDTGTTGTDTTLGRIITQDNSKAVANLSGRLAIKCFYTGRHYCMQPKASYMFKFDDVDKWTPVDEEALTVVNAESTKLADDEEPDPISDPEN